MTDRPETLLAILERLCAFKTISDRSNLELIGYCEQLLRDAGYAVTVLPDATGTKANLHAVKGDPVRPGLVLAGHTDVVPVEGQSWSGDPFRLLRDGDSLRARGVTDMKGFVAAALTFALEAEIVAADAPLHLVLTYDEETGCFGARDIVPYLRANLPAGSLCLLGEPTGLAPVIAHKGILGLRTEITGSDGHAARIRFGANAIHFAGELIGHLRSEGDRYAERSVPGGYASPHSTIQVGVIAGGVARNMIANSCRLDYEFRSVPEDDPDAFLARLGDLLQNDILPRMLRNEPAAGIETEVRSRVPAFRGASDGPFLQAVRRCFRDADPVAWDGVTEAGYYAQAGLEVIICGPGDITQPHRADERASLAALIACMEGLDRLLLALGIGAAGCTREGCMGERRA
ncbi:acetylornithine deacetylase [Frigidibacter sp. MR17.14]|uniref:acetylornithine deacetylase n=1 Tax=Frigidibacter sp. MR17.14 TaxID=3126509 RepID=UPI003012E95E